MTPNRKRLDALDALIRQYRPDAVVDVVLQACHSYNIESHTVERYVKEKHRIPFLKIETDYSAADVGRIRMRVEALFETMAC
jgi:benzoyl-CoA reductase/2-hydroxyglutaryl-CoA dehydratase subunit BcrC/BadD/HgdB